MRSLVVKAVSHLEGEITLLGDKSIAHRSIIISAIAPGKTTIENFPVSKDCLYTIKAFRKLGIKITQEYSGRRERRSVVTVFGKGFYGLKKPKGPIFVGDSGTTLRLILGVLAGQNFELTFTTGRSLSQRPMRRVAVPLRMMGAQIKACSLQRAACSEEYPPISIKGGALRGITYKMPVASAQVKSAILLAGLYARGETQVIEPVRTRDHTERMLRLFGADIKVNPSTTLRPSPEFIEGRSRTIKQNTIVIKRNKELVSPKRIYIPGDLSSASFFIVLTAIIPNSEVLIRNVSLNPSRIGIIKVLRRMGADINIKYQKSPPQSVADSPGIMAKNIKNDEPMGDLIVKSSTLKGTMVKKEEIPSLIDELPILMVAASLARGRTIFEGVEELRVKETDRIRSMSDNLRKMGANIKILKVDKSENIIIKGVKELYGNRVRSFGDHRTAMSMVVVGLRALGETFIDDITCINKSFPDFLSLLKSLVK